MDQRPEAGSAGGSVRTGIGRVWALVVLAVATGIWLGVPRATAVRAPILAAGPVSSEPAVITIHVSGWVVRPGLVELPEGARVADAVAAADGFRPGANLGGLNLAAPALDGSLVEVPGPDSLTPNVPGATGDGLIDLNRAGVDELEGLPGVGPVLAERIVAYRTDHGPFQAIEDLLSVSGIGERKLESLRPHLRPP
jgi:competence protein ComEA